MMPDTNVIIKVEDIHKTFQVGDQQVEVLKGIEFEAMSGDFIVVFGPSGCGKSTLLHTILGLERPTNGRVLFFGEDMYLNTKEDDRSEFRKRHIGMVYQQPNWVKSLTVLENVSFPLLLLGVDKTKAQEKARWFLEAVDMANWADYVPTELSSGQQQKISLARSLINNPEVIIADEPTGNLDFASGQEIMSLLANLNSEQGKSIIMVTHDLEYIKYSKSVIRMLDGRVIGIYGAGEKQDLLKSLDYKRGAGVDEMSEETGGDEASVKGDSKKDKGSGKKKDEKEESVQVQAGTDEGGSV